MKRFIIATGLAVIFPAMAHAQIGAEFGYAHSAYNKNANGIKTSVAMDGLYLQADYTFHVLNHFGISPGIQYEYVTAKDFAGTEADWNEHYIDIPVRLSYGFDLGKAAGLGIYAAPTFSINMVSKVNLHGVRKSVGDEVKRTDLMLGMGIYCNLISHIRVRLGYDYGLVDRGKGDEDKMRRARVQLGVAYLF